MIGELGTWRTLVYGFVCSAKMSRVMALFSLTTDTVEYIVALSGLLNVCHQCDTCETSYPCLIHSACDTHCTTASGCTTKGKDKCDTACVEGYGLETTGYTCVGEYVYVTIFLINVVSQNRLILMCNNSASYTFL